MGPVDTKTTPIERRHQALVPVTVVMIILVVAAVVGPLAIMASYEDRIRQASVPAAAATVDQQLLADLRAQVIAARAAADEAEVLLRRAKYQQDELVLKIRADLQALIDRNEARAVPAFGRK